MQCCETAGQDCLVKALICVSEIALPNHFGAKVPSSVYVPDIHGSELTLIAMLGSSIVLPMLLASKPASLYADSTSGSAFSATSITSPTSSANNSARDDDS